MKEIPREPEVTEEEWVDLLGFLVEQDFNIENPAWFRQGWDRKHLDRLYGYAYALFKNGHYAQAKVLFLFMSHLEAGRFEVMLSLGLTCEQLGQTREAFMYFAQASLFRPIDPRPYFFSGKIIEQLGLPKLARDYYDYSEKLCVAFPEAKHYSEAAREALLRLGGSELGRDPLMRKRVVAGRSIPGGRVGKKSRGGRGDV